MVEKLLGDVPTPFMDSFVSSLNMGTQNEMAKQQQRLRDQLAQRAAIQQNQANLFSQAQAQQARLNEMEVMARLTEENPYMTDEEGNVVMEEKVVTGDDGTPKTIKVPKSPTGKPPSPYGKYYEIGKKTSGGLAASRPLLDKEGLKTAVAIVNNNPAKIAEYPIYQKSQINNELARTGGDLTSSSQYAKIQEAKANESKTNATLNLLEEAFLTTNPSEKQLDTWANWVGRATGEKTKFSNNMVAYEALVKASIGNLARSLFGEKGVLTDQDIKRVRAALPDAKTTNRELASSLFGYLRSLNSSVASGTVKAYDYRSKDNFIDDIVSDLESMKERKPTGSGIKVGSALEALKAKYGGKK